MLARAAALAPATARPPRNSATPLWDPLDFIQTAGGVANKLHPVLNHLPPAPARVLDIGCALGPDLMRSGYDVRGMDVDARQVANARVRGVPAVIGDAQVCFPPELRPRALFDAVVSLDALHHMPHHASVVNNVASVLKTEGVFAGNGDVYSMAFCTQAGECGGAGSCSGALAAVADVLGDVAVERLNPWTFPAPGELRCLLHAAGFRDVVVTSSPRPVQCTAVEWYRTFGKVFLESVPVADRAAFLDDYRTACAHRLGGENRLDFVRLRWRAVRRDDRSR